MKEREIYVGVKTTRVRRRDMKKKLKTRRKEWDYGRKRLRAKRFRGRKRNRKNEKGIGRMNGSLKGKNKV